MGRRVYTPPEGPLHMPTWRPGLTRHHFSSITDNSRLIRKVTRRGASIALSVQSAIIQYGRLIQLLYSPESLAAASQWTTYALNELPVPS